MTGSGPLKLTVLGVGYLGAVHAACLAEPGVDVLGVDTDTRRIDALAAGRLPFCEPGLEPLLRRHLDSGRLQFTTFYDEAAAFGDVHFICVGTPQLPREHGADLGQLDACLSALAPLLRSPCLGVGKSTVPVGTAAALATGLARTAPARGRVELARNPEFLREGHAVEDSLRPAVAQCNIVDARSALDADTWQYGALGRLGDERGHPNPPHPYQLMGSQ